MTIRWAESRRLHLAVTAMLLAACGGMEGASPSDGSLTVVPETVFIATRDGSSNGGTPTGMTGGVLKVVDGCVLLDGTTLLVWPTGSTFEQGANPDTGAIVNEKGSTIAAVGDDQTLQFGGGFISDGGADVMDSLIQENVPSRCHTDDVFLTAGPITIPGP